MFHQSRSIDQNTESIGDSSWVTVLYICFVFKFYNKHFDTELLTDKYLAAPLCAKCHKLHAHYNSLLTCYFAAKIAERNGSRFVCGSWEHAEKGPLMYSKVMGDGECFFLARDRSCSLLCQQGALYALITMNSGSGLELRWNIAAEVYILTTDLCAVAFNLSSQLHLSTPIWYV